MRIYTLSFFLCFSIPLSLCALSSEEGVGVAPDEDWEPVDEAELEKYKEKEKETFHLHMTKLQKDVISRVSSSSRPFKGKEKLKLLFMLHSISHLNIDEREQAMNVTGRLCHAWRDPQLYWDPAKYDGVRVIRAMHWDLWTPQFEVTNSIRGVRSLFDIMMNDIKVYSMPMDNQSTVLTCPSFSFAVRCSMDFSRFPYDSHVCVFPLTDYINYQNLDISTSWSSFTQVSTVEMRHSTARNTTKPVVSDWKITNITTEVVFRGLLVEETTKSRQNEYQVPIALQSVYFHRHSPQFLHTLIIPSVIFGLFNTLSPLLLCPLQSLLLSLCTLVLLALFVKDLLVELPPISTRIPDIMLFWCLHLLLAFSMVLIFFVCALAQQRNKGRKVVTDGTRTHVLLRRTTIRNVYCILSFLSIVNFIILPMIWS